MSSIRGLLERAQPGDKIRWYSETDSRQRAPSTVEQIILEERRTVVELSGSRSARYKIVVPDQDSPYISRYVSDEDEGTHQKLEWVSIVAGEALRKNSLYNDPLNESEWG